MKLPIYLDHHATTPVDARVLAAMLPYFAEHFGNAASRSHSFGRRAEQAVELARRQIAELIGARAREVIFTSGATESDNLALKGVAHHYRSRGRHIITSRIEHPAVLDSCLDLERQGWEVTYLPVDRDGRVRPEDVAQAITEQTVLVSIMLANNEIGTVQPLSAIGEITRARGVLLHTDAAQGVGQIPFDVDELRVDLASLSAHKLYGPKGVGALYVRRSGPRVRLTAQIAGGGHERGLRSGTLNVPGIVGFGEACRLLQEQGAAEAERLRRLRDRLHARLTAELDDVVVNGTLTERLPGSYNVSFRCVEADTLMMALAKDVAASSGSACSSAAAEPSHVLAALGVSRDVADSAIRFGLGRHTTEEEIDHVAARVSAEVRKLRDLSPLYEAYRRLNKPTS